MAKNATARDNETRDRVLKVAARLFAERGFNHVSVRAICKEAGSNVAAVNYHFGDKLGLYRELIGTVAEGMNDGKISSFESGAGWPPEEQLHAYIRGFLHQLLDQNAEESCWLGKLIARETTEPTAALDLIIEKGIKPAGARLNKLVSEVMELPANDPRVILTAGATQGLCLWYRTSRTVAERMFPELKFTPDRIDRMADFVTDFSLAGMRDLVQNGKEYGGVLGARAPR
ncbi:MAG: CerR family C-terminal domain-containing protein [Terriglobia bacterium]|jgi:AcrR family transcriptional regulator